MTIWDGIYQKYKRDGEEYATLKKGLMPEFLDFIQGGDFKEKTVLDLGCGNGKYLAFLKNLGFAVDGIDSSPTAVEMSREIIGTDSNILLADIYNCDLPKGRYGLIISISAIHHGLKSQVKNAIMNAHSALLSGGKFFITLPDNDGSARWAMMSDYEEIEPGTRMPLAGPEKGLPHSSFNEDEIKEIFASFSSFKMFLLAHRGRWIISGVK